MAPAPWRAFMDVIVVVAFAGIGCKSGSVAGAMMDRTQLRERMSLRGFEVSGWAPRAPTFWVRITVTRAPIQQELSSPRRYG